MISFFMLVVRFIEPVKSNLMNAIATKYSFQNNAKLLY